MRYYRRLLGVSWKERIRNSEIFQRSQPRSRIMQMIMKRKLGLFGHICWMDNSRFIETVMFGAIEEKRKVKKPKRKGRGDQIKLSGMSFSTLTKIAKDKSDWKKKVNVAVGIYEQHNGWGVSVSQVSCSNIAVNLSKRLRKYETYETFHARRMNTFFPFFDILDENKSFLCQWIKGSMFTLPWMK